MIIYVSYLLFDRKFCIIYVVTTLQLLHITAADYLFIIHIIILSYVYTLPVHTVVAVACLTSLSLSLFLHTCTTHITYDMFAFFLLSLSPLSPSSSSPCDTFPFPHFIYVTIYIHLHNAVHSTTFLLFCNSPSFCFSQQLKYHHMLCILLPPSSLLLLSSSSLLPPAARPALTQLG